MDLTVYVLGDIDFTHRILVGMNMLYQGRSMHLMAGVILILYTMWAFIKWMLNPEQSPYPFREFAFGILFYMIFGGLEFISPRVDVRLETDNYNGGGFETHIVPDLPILVVAPAWIATNLFSGLRNTISPLLYVPGQHTGSQYPGSSSGLDPIAVLTQINGLSMQKIIDKKHAENIKEYVKNCLAPYQQLALLPGEGISDITNRPVDQIIGLMDVDINWMHTYFQDDNAASSGMFPCDLAYDKIVDQTISFKAKLKQVLSERGITETDISIALNQVFASFSSATMPDPYSFVVGKFHSTYFTEGLINYGYTPFEHMANKMMFEASQKRVFDRAAEANMFTQIMIPVITAIEAFTFFIAPILMLLTVMGGVGISYIGKYLLLTLFVNLWGFIKIFTDYFLLLTISKSFNADLSVASDYHPFTMVNQYGTYLELENFMSTAASLTAAIPMLSMFLLYGGVHSVMGVMRQMTGGSVDANNIAPTMATNGNNGVLTAGDTTNMRALSNGANFQTHNPGSSAVYGATNAGNDLTASSSDVLGQARSNVTSTSSALTNSVNAAFETNSTGSNSVTGGTSDTTNLSIGKQMVNSAADQVVQSVDTVKGEQGQALAKIAAAAGLSLRADASAKQPDLALLDEKGAERYIKRAGVSMGVSGQVAYETAQQLAQSQGISLKDLVSATENTLRSDSEGQTYSKGFNFSDVDTKTKGGKVSDTAATISANLEQSQEAQANVRTAQDLNSRSTSISESKTAQWHVFAGKLAQSGSGQQGFESFWSGLEDNTKDKFRDFAGGGSKSPSEVYGALLSSYGDDPTKMIKGAMTQFSRQENFNAAADIANNVAPYSGVYGSGFKAVGKAFEELDRVDSKIDTQAEQQGLDKSVNSAILAKTGQVEGQGNVQQESQTRVDNPIENQAIKEAQNYNFVDSQGNMNQLSADIKSGLSTMTPERQQEVLDSMAQLQNNPELLQSEALRPGIGAITSIVGGIGDVVDYFSQPDPIWGNDADNWAATGSSIAAKAGYDSGSLYEGMKNLATFGADDYQNLEAGIKEGDKGAFIQLGQLNDASLFLRNTETGQDVLKSLSNPEDQQRTIFSMMKTEDLVNGLSNNSPLTSGEMNAISVARLDGSITEGQGDALLELGGAETGNSTWQRLQQINGTNDDVKSLLFSASHGAVADNEVLMGVLSESNAKINMSPEDYSNNPALFQFQKPQQVIENLNAGNSSPLYNSFGNAYSADVMSDSVQTGVRSNAFEYNQDNHVTGVNMQLLNTEKMSELISDYSKVVTQRESDGTPTTDFEEWNNRIINTATGRSVAETVGDIADASTSNPFRWGNSDYEPIVSQQHASTLAFAVASSAGQFENRFKGPDGDADLLKQAFDDLSYKSTQEGIVLNKNVLAEVLAPKIEGLDVKSSK